MIKLFKSVLSGVSVALLYILAILIAPFIIRFSGNTNFLSQPEVMNAKLYAVQVSGNEFNSQTTAMGFVISIALGIVLYYVMDSLTSRRHESSHRTT
ncbi:hypothetical protein [Thalassobacillus sp. CUG 92003]|uniref:hypothetical protein n=1 Tax=Thalassobacillus sp. CUG 92003 TaxID=2736641 RepID=UPI0015E7D885|nr:hypothetical protein [Thalassobacillus sp. CUG 92003]